MKTFLKIILVLLVIAVVAAAVLAGMFYKKATPTLLVDLSENGGKSETLCTELFSPEQSGDGTALTSAYWTAKWCGDMGEKSLKSTHYDLTGYDFKTYLKHLKGFNFGGFSGVASISGDKSELNILCKGGNSDASVVLYGFGKTPFAGKTLEIKVEEAVFKGEEGELVLPVILRDYTASAADKLIIKLNSLDKNNIYHIRITEADKSAAPAYENDCIPKRYALDGELSADVKIDSDGEYTLSYIFSACSENSSFEINVDGKGKKSAETFATEKSSCVSRDISLKKGTHKIQIVSEEALPEFEGLVVSPSEDNNSVYVLEDKSQKTYYVYAPEEGDYSVTSTELEGNITVNSADIPLSEIGSATVRLKKGLNEIKINSAEPDELKITMITD